MNMQQKANKERFSNVDISDEARQTLLERNPTSQSGPNVACEVEAFRLVSSVITWLDVISSVTLGSAPRLFAYDATTDYPEFQAMLDKPAHRHSVATEF